MTKSSYTQSQLNIFWRRITVLSPSCFTRQFKYAVCPTCAVTLRTTSKSKYGWNDMLWSKRLLCSAACASPMPAHVRHRHTKSYNLGSTEYGHNFGPPVVHTHHETMTPRPARWAYAVRWRAGSVSCLARGRRGRRRSSNRSSSNLRKAHSNFQQSAMMTINGCKSFGGRKLATRSTRSAVIVLSVGVCDAVAVFCLSGHSTIMVMCMS